jgi:hypothetical protein
VRLNDLPLADVEHPNGLPSVGFSAMCDVGKWEMLQTRKERLQFIIANLWCVTVGHVYFSSSLTLARLAAACSVRPTLSPDANVKSEVTSE